MTEIRKIEKGIATYNKAWDSNNAYIMVGNTVFRMSVDGPREMVNELA